LIGAGVELKRTTFFGIGTILLGVALASPAWAYRVLEQDGEPVGWGTSTVVFDIEQTMPDGVQFDSVLAQVQSAADIWNTEKTCGAPKIQITPVRAGAGASGDGRNTIQWVHTNWAGTGQPDDATGYTDILIEKTKPGAKIVETDIWLNGENYSWTTGEAQLPTLVGVLATVSHEMGHALGMDHPCEFDADKGVPDCDAQSDQSALMFPALVVTEPKLTSDDVGGLCTLYPLDECKVDGTGCSSEPTGTIESECTQDKDCSSTQTCLFGHCVEIPRPTGDKCDEDYDCETGRCEEEVCRESCTADLTCLSGELCNTKTLVCGRGAKAFSTECNDAEDCVTGLCYIDPGSKAYCTRFCDSLSPCADGWECTGEDEVRRFCVITQIDGDGCSIARTKLQNRFGFTWVFGSILLIGLQRVFRKRMGK
jgi:hypothetical protein